MAYSKQRVLLLFLLIVAVAVQSQNITDLSGAWTGFTSVPLYDSYEIVHDVASGALNVTCTSGSCGWQTGIGKVSGTQVSILVDSGVTITGPISLNNQIYCGWTDTGALGPLPPAHTASCTVLIWDNNTKWVKFVPITKVHVVFMNHLDVGYNGIPMIGYINNILNIYFHQYFPRAIAIGEDLSPFPFVYTAHPWVVALYLDCPPNFSLNGILLQCPSSGDVIKFKSGVEKGYITWHRGPFNLQPENMDPTLFEYGISMAVELDQQFGFTPKNTMSQRDVPGMTRAVVPLLAKHNVTAVSVGVNGASCPPNVPSAFIWRDLESGAEVIAMWHAGGYPNNPGTTPANAGGLARRECVVVRGHTEALCWAFRTDNSGPPANEGEVFQNLALVSSQFPGAHVVPSTFDAFVNGLAKHRDLLPVFTQEIGDVWLQGIASDPLKMSTFRAITRARAACINSGACAIDDAVVRNASRWLIKPPEHTWGLPSVGDGQTSLWSNQQFEKARTGQIYLNCENAWAEQRQFNTWAVDTLVEEKHPLAQAVSEELSKIVPYGPLPMSAGYQKVSNMATVFDCGFAKIGFDGKTGAISTLIDTSSGDNFAGPTSPLAQLVYTTYDESGYNSQLPCNNVLGGKPGANEAHPKNLDWYTQMLELWNKPGTCQFFVQIAMPNETVDNYGGFQKGWISLNATRSTNNVSSIFDIDFQWFNKTSTRLAESYMMYFTPTVLSGTNSSSWIMSKLASHVNPLDVVQGGCQNQHSVWNGVTYSAKGHKAMQILSQDVPLVSPVTTKSRATPLVNSVDPLQGTMLGFAWNIYNNIWNTNYIYWYPMANMDGKDHRFRFQISI